MTRLQNLTPEERRVLALYMNPRSSDLRRALRLSVQYAIGAGFFIALAIFYDEPRYSVGAYAAFLMFLVLRLLGARKLAGVMPRVIRKYEERITELELQLESRR
jgi:hypothetical protein